MDRPGHEARPQNDFNPLDRARRESRLGFALVGVTSAIINLLSLTSAFFMLQVYDRVIPSQSIPTLVALGLLTLLLYLFQTAFEIMRGRTLIRIAGVFDEIIGQHIFAAVVSSPSRDNAQPNSAFLMRDFDRVKAFLSSAGLPAFFDLPWLPFYVGLSFLFHPLIGVTAIAGATFLASFTYITHIRTERSSRLILPVSIDRQAVLDACHRNAEVVHAMGMREDMVRSWLALNANHRLFSRASADAVSTFSAISKIARISLQSAMLALGAVLVIKNQASGGIIIAASILLTRALAPVEQAIANWQNFVLAKQAWQRLKNSSGALLPPSVQLVLPKPNKSLNVDGLFSAPPGQREPIIANISFSLKSGDAMAIIGPSASGKSALARALTGIWPLRAGAVRLDGATLDQWPDSDRGQCIGYLPQDIELFAGTVAQNIARFRPNAASSDIIDAAMTANVHDLILTLPQGYDTQIGVGGAVLSAGQRQRIALARAVFERPFLVVLDEPNSNLDSDGEAALGNTIATLRRHGSIVVIIAHRASAIAGVDLVLVLKGGRIAAFGPKADVLPKFSRQPKSKVLGSSVPYKISIGVGG
ncbi:type I secretion system permease/ATPase [Neorhizobium sp. NCHU2750]|uniref:type I secretion system permease/ATPase n=1 Tax=Neorhizobium sp. NCHU2750 TaxID=1825976 RepID=UPI000E73B45B|nr:type I secretion protein [Neorhizobium sp. NCHU2750]